MGACKHFCTRVKSKEMQRTKLIVGPVRQGTVCSNSIVVGPIYLSVPFELLHESPRSNTGDVRDKPRGTVPWCKMVGRLSRSGDARGS